MEFKTVEQVRQDLEKRNQKLNIANSSPTQFKNIDTGFYDPSAGKIAPIRYTGGFGNVYEKGFFGNYQMRYENYLGAFGNEDRLGKQQSAWEQTWNGITKNVSKAGLYALDSTVGLLYGIGAAIGQGKMSALWDNDLSTAFDYASKSLDRELPNYYTDEQKSAGFFGNLLTANFLANDFMNGLAFVGGAVLPSLALGTLTGGGSLVASGGRLGAKWGLSLARKTGKEALRYGLRGAKIGKGFGTGVTLLQSSVFEAGMEARHNFHDSIDTWMNEYMTKNGQAPSIEETQKYIQSAELSSNYLFGGNVTLLTLTNAAMFGKALGVGKIDMPGSNTFNRMIGIGTKQGEKGLLKAIEPSRLQKILGKSYYIGRKPFSEGIVEEGTQGVMSKMAQDYTNAKYEGDDTYSFLQSLSDSLVEQYGTKEGWKEMGIGMMVGMLGGNVHGSFGVEGVFGKNTETFSKKVGEINGLVEQRNKYVDMFRGLNRTNSMFNTTTTKEEGLKDTQLFQDTTSNYSYIQANMPLKGMTDMAADYDAVVDSLEITDEQLTDSGLSNDTEYRDQMKSQFRSDLRAYEKADSLVRGIDFTNVDLTKGNLHELTDAVRLSLMAGEKAKEQTARIADNISQITGETGTLNTLNFFSQLNTKQADNIAKLTQQKENLSGLENELVKIQSDIESAKAETDSKEKVKELSKKYVATSNQIERLTNSIESTRSTLNNEFNAIKASDLTLQQSYDNIDDVLDTMSKLKGMSKSLRAAGRTRDAKMLESNIEQFNVFSQTALDAKMTIDAVANPNFWKKGKGKSLMSSILGEKYEPSKQTIDDAKILENDLIDKASQFGYSIANTEQFFNEYLKENEELSDREKYKVEALARAMATQRAILDRADEVQSKFEESATQEPVTEISLEEVENITVDSPKIIGDTVKLAKKLQSETNITTADQLEMLVDEIANLVDKITNKPTSVQLKELNSKKQELENLKNLLNSEQNGTVYQQSPESLYVRQQTRDGEKVGERDTQEQEVTQESQKEEIVFPQEISKEEITDSVEEVINSLSEEDNTDAIVKLLEDAVEYENSSEFGNEDAANELTDLLNRIKNGEINIDEVGSLLNRQTVTGDQESSQGTTGEVPASNAGTEQIPQSDEELIRQKEERIQRLRDNIDELESEIFDLERPFKFTDSSEYKQYKKLLEIPEEQRTQEDVENLESLRNDINNWIWIMGTETEGVDFSGLVEQMVKLDSLQVNQVPDTVEVTEEEIEENFQSINKANNQNLSVGLNFNSVTATRKVREDKTIFTEISNISLQGLEVASGVNLEGREGVSQNEITRAIQLDDDIVDEINSLGSVNIPTAETITGTYYSPVRKVVDSISGEGLELKPLETDFDNEEPQNKILDEDVYNLNKGQQVFIKIDPNDEFNKELFTRVKKELNYLTSAEIEQEVSEQIKSYRTQQLTKAQKKLRDVLDSKTKDKQKIMKAEDDVQSLLDSEKERIRKRLVNTRRTKLSEELKSELRESLKIMITDADGNNVSILKRSRNVNNAEKEDLRKLQTIRASFADNIDFLVTAIETGMFESIPSDLTVRKVFMGFPNYNVIQNTNGNPVRITKDITRDQMDKIHDTGYVQNGKVLTKSGLEDVDTTLLKKQLNSKSNEKYPIVIIKKGNLNIAYPVTVSRNEAPVTAEEMRGVYSSTQPEKDKAIILNGMLAKAGIDTSLQGNAFIALGEDMIDKDFFESKVAQVENMAYIRSVDDFVDKSVSKEDTLLNNAKINLNLSNPFFSPKVKFDFSKVQVSETITDEETRAKSKTTVKNQVSPLLEDRQKVCK